MTDASPADTLVTMVDRAVEAHPDRASVIDVDGESISYRELGDLADRFAAALEAAGVVAGDRVGVCRWKSAGTVASLLGILRLGAAYVPVDPGSPPERNRTIFEDGGVTAIVVDERTADVVPGLPDVPRIPAPAPDGARPGSRTPPGCEDLAYILYTSGSTGRPKGVCLEHRHATSFVDWCRRTFACGPDDRVTSHAPFHFDLSILDLWMTLASGGAVCLIEETLAKDPRRLVRFVEERGITIWYSVPSILGLMATSGRPGEHRHDTLRIVCFAGEVFPLPGLRALRAAWPEPVFWNLYGPTETNVCTAHRLPSRIESSRTEPFPIGAACDHCRIRIADESGAPVPPGRVGRILCAGAPVMRTYWGRSAGEVEAFEEIEGRRWYDTGDLGEADEAGVVTFRGRRDRMVKRHGYRIELGEIEAGLSEADVVGEAAVWAEVVEGTTTIHAAVTPAGNVGPSIISLRALCSRILPSYMTPDRFHLLAAIPRTSTGKIDYQSLRGGAEGP